MPFSDQGLAETSPKASFETLQGGQVEAKSAGRVTKLGKAAITRPDVMASNGAIHVVDKVILPE